MRTLLIQSAGVLALVAALIHGVIAETKIFPRIRIEPERLRLLYGSCGSAARWRGWRWRSC